MWLGAVDLLLVLKDEEDEDAQAAKATAKAKAAARLAAWFKPTAGAGGKEALAAEAAGQASMASGGHGFAPFVLRVGLLAEQQPGPLEAQVLPPLPASRPPPAPFWVACLHSC